MVERSYHSLIRPQTRVSQRPVQRRLRSRSTLRETFGSQVLRELELKNSLEYPSLDEILSFYHFPWAKIRHKKDDQKKKRSTLYSLYFEQVNSGRIQVSHFLCMFFIWRSLLQFSFIILLSICISEAIFASLISAWIKFSILCILTVSDPPNDFCPHWIPSDGDNSTFILSLQENRACLHREHRFMCCKSLISHYCHFLMLRL